MNKQQARIRRGLKTKNRIKGNSVHRLVVFRSGKHIYAQVAKQELMGDRVVACSSTVDKELKGKLTGSKVDQAFQVGKLVGERAKSEGVEMVAFDRSGYSYIGRVKALADGAREAGLNF